MISTKHKAAEALAPMLSGFHSLAEQPLRAVWQVYTDGSLDRLIVDFGELSMILAADENDDSIDVTIEKTPDPRGIGGLNRSNHEPWASLIGKSFGWGWVTINQQGYCDGLLLSFAGIIPQIIVNVIASSIKVATISPASG